MVILMWKVIDVEPMLAVASRKLSIFLCYSFLTLFFYSLETEMHYDFTSPAAIMEMDERE